MPVLAPDTLDRAAAALADRGEVQPFDRAAFDRIAALAPVSKTVDQLIADAGIATGPAPQPLHLPGRLRRLLPVRRIITVKPSQVLTVAQAVLEQWGWQNKPHHLHDIRGRRCICGAIGAAHDLGYGVEWQAERAAWHVLMVLRGRGWPHLIGDWNQAPGRTAEQALAVVAEARQRAADAGE